MIFRLILRLVLTGLLFSCNSNITEKQTFVFVETSNISNSTGNSKQIFTKYKGVYKNIHFGFKATIPSDLEGESSPPPLPQHGFKITISKNSAIYVSGEFNFQLRDSLNDAIKNEKENFDDAKKILGTKTRFIKIDGLKFVEISTKYIDKDDKTKVEDALIALTKRNDESAEIVYEMRLETSDEQFSKDNEIFQKVVNSWKQIPILNE